MPKVAVFIDGYFWYGYKYRTWKAPLKSFWLDKIVGNYARDCRNFKAVRAMGWKVVRVWEHDVNKNLEEVAERVFKAWSKATGVDNPDSLDKDK